MSCCLLLVVLSAKGQVCNRNNNYGFHFGIISALGNRFQRVGLSFQTYYYRDFVQASTEVRFYHNFRNLGPPVKYNEFVAAAGLLVGYGVKQKWCNPFYEVVANHTYYQNSIGYSYNYYFNKIKTRQQTGIIGLQFGQVSIISENDIFARPTLDRFRTGAFLVQYQYKNLYQFALNCAIWTGQMGHKVTNDSNFTFGCYMDTTGGVYTHYSHGLLSGQFKMALPAGQDLQTNLGIDAEQVRNFVQNRLIHDMVMLPKKWHNPQNCHIPMLTTAGDQYIYLPGQKIKPTELYWNFFTGGAVFY